MLVFPRIGKTHLYCSTCNKWRPLSHFGKNAPSASGYNNSRCNVCHNRRLKWNHRQHIDYVNFMFDCITGRTCEGCGCSMDVEGRACFSYHHIYEKLSSNENKKERRIGDLKANCAKSDDPDNYFFKSVRPELLKCILLCEKCHRQFHAKQGPKDRIERIIIAMQMCEFRLGERSPF